MLQWRKIQSKRRKRRWWKKSSPAGGSEKSCREGKRDQVETESDYKEKRLEYLDLSLTKANLAQFLDPSSWHAESDDAIIESWVRCRPGSNAKHGKRFTEAMYHWAITLQYIGGNKLLKLMAENLACPTKRSIARRLAFHNPLELHKVQECVKNALASLSPSALIREGARGTV